jgi:hypothetical protein
MAEQDVILGIMATALRDARANSPQVDPVNDPGLTRPRIVEPYEHGIPFAKAILIALDRAGFEIVRKK